MIRCRWSVNVSRRRSPISSHAAARQRLGGDDQRVDRRHRAPLAGEGGGVALGGADARRPARDRAAVGHHPAGLDRGDAGVLVDVDAAPLDRGGQAADQPGGVERRAVGGVRRPEGAGGASTPSRRLRASSRRVVRVAAPGPGVVDLGAGARAAGRGVRASAIVPPLREVGVDALGRRHPAHLVDRGPHRGVLGERGLARRTRQPGERRSEAGKSAEHQPPLRPDAPNPAFSASSTTTRSVGSASAR